MELRTTFLLTALVLASCSQGKKAEPQVPRPGEERLLQIYLLTDAAGAGTWFPPSDTAWSSELPARVERAVVADDVTAEKILREWNARTIDVLILGSGKPIEVWNRLRLPLAVKRLTVGLGETPVEGLVTIMPDRERLKAFWEKACRPRGCVFEPASEAEKAGLPKLVSDKGQLRVRWGRGTTELPAALEVQLAWPRLVRDLVERTRNGERVEGLRKVGAFSGFLDLSLGTQLQGEEAKTLEKQREDWLLSELSRGSLK